MRRLRSVAVALTVLIAAAPALAALPAPALRVETADGLSRVVVDVAGADGTTTSVTLRETTAAVVPGPTGFGPEGRAAFAIWTEGADATWSSWSRDGGETWSQARPLDLALHLRDGAVRPGEPLPLTPAGTGLGGTGRLFLVQLRSTSLPEWRAALAAAGAEVLRFFPSDAHIVRVDPALVERLARLDFVARVEPYLPSFRLEPELRAWLAEPDDAGPRETRVRAMAFAWGPEGKARIAEAAESWGARLGTYWPSGHILELRVDRAQLRKLAAHDEVEWVDRWTPAETDMDLVREDAGDNWLETNYGRCGQGVRGEVMDAGIQQDHPDFDGILMHTPASVASHGTSTYGIVFGNGDRDGDGQAKGTGHMPCPEAQGIFADYDNVSDRFAETQELKNPPYEASFQSNSWGNALTTAYNSISSQMDDIIFRLDIAITQSQSNNGNQQSRPQAWAKNIISVGGIRHYDTLDTSDDRWANGASIGPAADGRIKPDVSYWYDSIYTTTTGSAYTSSFGGTSAATPEVAGVLGLMVQMWSDNVWGANPQGPTVFARQPHFSTIKALLVNNAQQYPFSGVTADLTRTHQGWGRPSVKVAQERAARSFVVDETDALLVGQRKTYDVVVQSGETELKITMIYPDPPGTTSASLHRINDVDLTVTSPVGDVYHGNVGLDAGNYSAPGGSPNGVDTVENVFVQNPAAGSWRIDVDAVEVNQDGHLATPEDDVAFALVVTGAAAVDTCGNGVRDPGEQCDGADLGGATCEGRGCTGGGTLACTSECTFDTSACSACPTCGDGTCDLGEDCASCPADCVSESGAACGNGVCESADGEDCVTCPADCNGVQNGKPTSRYCCGAGGGENPVDCADARCSTTGKTCTTLPVYAYCCGDGTCESPETDPSCRADCAAPTPGEAARGIGMLRVSAYDAATGAMTIDYGAACSATDHVLEWGELTPASLASYAWEGQGCGMGTSGTWTWTPPASPASIFFVVVGQGAASEGSYGRDSGGTERPEDVLNVSCAEPQDLRYRCD